VSVNEKEKMHAAVTWLREWLDWQAERNFVDHEDAELALQRERRELIELPNTPSSAAMLALIRDAADDMFVMLVDKQRWHANAGIYGVENEPLDVRRLPNLIPLLLEKSIPNTLLYAHRNKHLDAENRRLLNYSAVLVDDEHLLVVFAAPTVGDPTKLRGPFVKMLFGYAEFVVQRDTSTGVFHVPTLAAIKEQCEKSKFQKFEQLPPGTVRVNLSESASNVPSPRLQRVPFSAREMRDVPTSTSTTSSSSRKTALSTTSRSAASISDDDVIRLLSTNEVVSRVPAPLPTASDNQ